MGGGADVGEGWGWGALLGGGGVGLVKCARLFF